MLLLTLPSSPPIATLPDDQVVLRARAGDARAGEEIVCRYRSIANGICARFYLPGAERSDLESHCLMGLWHAVQKFNTDRNCDFRLFASHCMQRHAMNAIRGANRGKHSFLNDASDLDSIAETYHETPADHENKRLLALEIQNLLDPTTGFMTDLEARIVQLRFEGWKTVEIAEELGLAPKNVGIIWNNVRARMRTTLAAAATEYIPVPRQCQMCQVALLTVATPTAVIPRPRRARRKKHVPITNSVQLSLF